ncbi:hypothetical protein D046_4401A, partial [Vibrio parahaemolyticus V-223/04]
MVKSWYSISASKRLMEALTAGCVTPRCSAALVY